MSWLQTLKDYAEQHPIVVLRFTAGEWESLSNSRRGVGEFTVALPHALVNGVKAPAPCLLLGREGDPVGGCCPLFSGRIVSIDLRCTAREEFFISRQRRTSSFIAIAEAEQLPHREAGNYRLQ